MQHATTSPRAKPRDLIAQRQEETGALGIPADAKPSSDWLTKPATIIRRGKPGGPLISAGGIYEVVPQGEFLTGQVFEDATIIGGGPYACGFTETHLGRASRPLKFLPQFIENLAKAAEEFGVDEIVFTHDACYNVATTLAVQQGMEVPFRPVHILEYIRNWLRPSRPDHKPARSRDRHPGRLHDPVCTERRRSRDLVGLACRYLWYDRCYIRRGRADIHRS